MMQNHGKTLLKAMIVKRSINGAKYSRNFSSSVSYNQKFSISKNKKKTNTISELSYEEESNSYLLKELLNSQKAFYKENQKLSEISLQFKEVIELYGLTLQKAPLKEPVPFFEEGIHLSKQVDHINFDLLLDYRLLRETDSREIQLVATTSKNSSCVLYCMGQLNKEDGILFDSAIVIDAVKVGKSSKEIRNGICNGEKWVFNKLINHYQKPLDISPKSVREFLLANVEYEYDFSDMDGRVFVDALLNYYLLESLNLRTSNPDGSKLKNLLWLLANYSETCLQERWLSNMVSFVK